MLRLATSWHSAQIATYAAIVLGAEGCDPDPEYRISCGNTRCMKKGSRICDPEANPAEPEVANMVEMGGCVGLA